MYKKFAFSLIELIVCMGALMILSTIAYPIYESHLVRTHRQKAEIQLLKLAQELEIYHAENHRYEGFQQALLNPYYEIQILGSEEEYLIQATPKAKQAKRDKDCGTLSLSNTGKRSISGGGRLSQCWSQ